MRKARWRFPLNSPQRKLTRCNHHRGHHRGRAPAQASSLLEVNPAAFLKPEVIR
jgi:hypothetical protein